MVRSDNLVHILGRDMSGGGASFELPSDYGQIAASEEFIYASQEDCDIRCLTHAGTEVAKYEDPDKHIACPVLAPGGLLFCNLFDEDYSTQDEIVALDAQTLQPRHRFGLSLLDGACGMVVVGEELFVCDSGNDRLHVFSLAGEHRRSITGEWKRPLTLYFVKERLDLVEKADADEDGEGELINPLQGRRIFVLSLQGDTLQVYTHPVEWQIFSHGLCCFEFDGKSTLLAPVQDAGKFVEVVTLLGI